MRSSPSSCAGRRSVLTGSVGMDGGSPRPGMLHDTRARERRHGRAVANGRDAVRGDRRSVPSPPMRIAMVASECEPFAKTGGLADVVDALRAGASVPAGATRSTSTCRATAASAARRTRAAASCWCPWAATRRADRRARAGAGDAPGAAHADGYRLRLVEHDAGLRPRGPLRRRGRRLPRQRRPVHAARAGRAGGDARRGATRGRAPRPRLAGRPGAPVAAQPLRPRPAAGAAGDRADLPQPRLPRLGARERGVELDLPADIGDADGRRPAARGGPARRPGEHRQPHLRPRVADPRIRRRASTTSCASARRPLHRHHQRHRPRALGPGHRRRARGAATPPTTRRARSPAATTCAPAWASTRRAR